MKHAEHYEARLSMQIVHDRGGVRQEQSAEHRAQQIQAPNPSERNE